MPELGWREEVVSHGMSGARVARLTRPGEPPQFCKQQAPTWDRGVDAEADRLVWLAETPMAPRVAQVLHVGRLGGDDVLYTSALDGSWPGTPAAFGRALRELHDTLDPAACPFDARLDVRLEQVARRVREGGTDAGVAADEILERVLRTRPHDEDLVVTHGDWCYPNVLFTADGDWSMVDLAGLGVACRWYDIAIGVRSTWHNHGPDAGGEFLAGYGVEPDEELIRYYILVDELQ